MTDPKQTSETPLPEKKPIPWAKIGIIGSLVISVFGLLFTEYNIKLTREHFETSNTPNLAIGAIYFGRETGIAKTDTFLSMTYHILDLRNRPVQVYYYRDWFRFDTVSLGSLIDTIKSIPYQEKNSFVDYQYPLYMTISISHRFYDSAQRYRLNHGYCTFFTDFIYYDDATNHWRRFLTAIRASSNNYNCTRENPA